MAGVIINGFGWSDSYYPRLNLGQHYCKFCNSMQNFSCVPAPVLDSVGSDE